MNKKGTHILVYISMFIFGAFMLYPFIWMILSAFKSNLEIIKVPPTFFPEKFTFEAFAKVLNETPFFLWIKNSLIVSVIGTIMTVFSSALGGYIFAKFDFKGKNFLFMIILATMMLPFQVIMIPLYMITSKLHLLNSLWALIIPGITSAFGIFLCKQHIEGIPNELMEAGRIDGCGEFGIFFRIIVPDLRNILSALAIFSFMGKWNDYVWPLIAINDMKKMTVPLALSFFSTQHGVQFNLVMAVAFLMMLPVIIVYLIFQKQFIEGLTMTGMK